MNCKKTDSFKVLKGGRTWEITPFNLLYKKKRPYPTLERVIMGVKDDFNRIKIADFDDPSAYRDKSGRMAVPEMNKLVIRHMDDFMFKYKKELKRQDI